MGLGSALYWFIACLLLAGLEIEAEGKYGWAEKMPTWFRVTGFIPRAYALLMSGKPLTGYHAFMFFLPLAMTHAGFANGVAWSWAEEFRVFAVYSAICVVWDFLWFVFNPHFGTKNFTKDKVWWYSKSHWVCDLFPFEYLLGIQLSVFFAFIGGQFAPERGLLSGHLTLLGWMAAFTTAAVACGPAYRRWRSSMDTRDERDRAGIKHVD